MRKLIVLALTQVRLTCRDVGGLLLALGLPFILSLGAAIAFGRGEVRPAAQPVLLINRDPGPAGCQLVAVFESEAVKPLVSARLTTDEVAARAQVQANQVTALVTIPPDFSAALATEGAEPAVVAVYASPTRPIGALIVQSILTQFLERANVTARGAPLVLRELVAGGVVAGSDTAALQASRAALDGQLAQSGPSPSGLKIVSPAGRAFNWLDYLAPSMAILFLMFSVSGAGRVMLHERQQGTLARLLVSPTPPGLILIGKMSGIALSGLLQVLILWGSTSLIGAHWGAPLPVALSIGLLVMCATGLGAIIGAWARSQAQAAVLGPAVVLVAAALSGNFFPRMNLPAWVRLTSLVTPNAWGLELVMQLQKGAGWPDILPLLGGLLTLTLIYLAIAAAGFRRQFA